MQKSRIAGVPRALIAGMQKFQIGGVPKALIAGESRVAVYAV
tara:strand:+ start:610 stop:735 length:126 start_codon:yes stop_codon:yes gene_type:complete